MSMSSTLFTLDGLKAEVAAAEAAEAHPATPPAPADTSAASPTPTPASRPAAEAPPVVSYVDLDHWRSDASSPNPPNAAADDPYETRYRVLQGKYDAEVPRLQARIRELETQRPPAATQDTELLRSLQSQVDTLQKELTAQRAGPAPAETTSADLDDDLAFEYGEAGARVIRDLRQQVQTLQQQTDARIESIEARDATRTRDAFRARLLDQLGEDRHIFNEPGWADFVQQRNPYAAGQSYNASLIDADAAGDLDTILNIVHAYRAAHRTTAPTPPPDPFGALAVPARVQASDVPAAGQRFRMGDLGRMIRKWQHGEKTFAELQSFERAFTAAEQSGLVDP